MLALPRLRFCARYTACVPQLAPANKLNVPSMPLAKCHTYYIQNSSRAQCQCQIVDCLQTNRFEWAIHSNSLAVLVYALCTWEILVSFHSTTMFSFICAVIAAAVHTWKPLHVFVRMDGPQGKYYNILLYVSISTMYAYVCVCSVCKHEWMCVSKCEECI